VEECVRAEELALSEYRRSCLQPILRKSLPAFHPTSHQQDAAHFDVINHQNNKECRDFIKQIQQQRKEEWLNKVLHGQYIRQWTVKPIKN
jgi:hypothetical protein